MKKAVYDRDGGRCVLCGKTYQAEPNAHIVARSQGGLGIEQNIVTLCRTCHDRYDQTAERHALRAQLEQYIRGFYPDWNEQNVTYHKFNF